MVTVVPMGTGASWADYLGVAIALAAFAVAFSSWTWQAEPEVIVYGTTDVQQPTMVSLVIANVGRGIARDIKFTSSQPIPSKAFGLDDAAEVAEPVRDGPFIKGIPMLAPGDKRVILWGQYWGLRNSLAESQIEITANYQSKRLHWWPRAKRHKLTSAIDIETFNGSVSFVGTEERIARALEALLKEYTRRRG